MAYVGYTSLDKYVSEVDALNIPNEEGTSGDWHPSNGFDLNREVIYGGLNSDYNTLGILGHFGIKDRYNHAIKVGLMLNYDVCYVANHIRAILDLVYRELLRTNKVLTMYCASEDFLDTEEQKELLLTKAELLLPYLTDLQKINLKKWIDHETIEGYRS